MIYQLQTVDADVTTGMPTTDAAAGFGLSFCFPAAVDAETTAADSAVTTAVCGFCFSSCAAADAEITAAS